MRTMSDVKGRTEKFELREFRTGEEMAVNEVALEAFYEYRDYYDDWAEFSNIIGNMASLSQSGELIVATVQERVVGAVVYVSPGRRKSEIFPPEWPILRMLVVTPQYRGLGIGRALTKECMRRAQRDGASLIALHTSEIMTVALSMYECLGFRRLHETPNIFGISYAVYVMELTESH